MTVTGLPDNSVPEAAARQGPNRQLTQADPPSLVVTPLTESTDPETRHRLRRALRILLAARRRDDGVESN